MRIFVIISLLGLASAEARTWTSADGARTFEAEFVKKTGQSVTVKRDDGRTLTFDIDLVSEADRIFVQNQSDRSNAAEWPRLHGADFSNCSPDKNLMKSWPAGGPELLWTFEQAGLGHSGPAIAGDRLFTMGARGESTFLIAIDIESGEETWATEMGPAFEGEGQGIGPRGTPTVAGNRVLGITGHGQLVCVDRETGAVLWKAHIRDFGGRAPTFGIGECPLVDSGLVFLTPGAQKSDHGIVAIDVKTGEMRWQTRFPTIETYSSPIAVERGGRRQLIHFFRKKVVGLAIADGELLWEYQRPGIQAVVTQPIYQDGHVYLTSAHGVGSTLIRLDGNQPARIYHNSVMLNHHGGVVHLDGHLYGNSDMGGWKCQNLMTGEEIWRYRQFPKGSITCADGMLYCLSERDGTIVLVEAGTEEWRERGRFQMPASPDRIPGKIWTHPVVIGGKLYLRDQSHFFCYDVGG